jgi:hypothetical protein
VNEAVDEAVVSRFAAVEDRDDGQNSTAVGGMEELAAAAAAGSIRSLAVGCKSDLRPRMNIPLVAVAAAVIALERGVELVKALELGVAQGCWQTLSGGVKEFFQAAAE